MYLTQTLHRAARVHPKKTATIFGSRRTDYATMQERVARLAGAFRTAGVNTGDRVGILSLNSDRYLEYYFGTYWAGGVVNPCNIRWSASEIAYALADCDTRVLLVDDQFLPVLAQIRGLAPCISTVIHCGDAETPDGLLGYEKLIAANAPAEESVRGGEDLAGVFYTGGTTGSPKGVMLPHRALYVNALALQGAWGEMGNMVGLHAAPMFHLADGAFTNALAMAGGTHVMVPMFHPGSVAQAIERERVTGALLVPTMIQMLADAPGTREHDLSSLEFVLYGGSPIAEAVIDRALAVMPKASLMQAYGMTELGPVATLLKPAYHAGPDRSLGKIRSGGQPCAICDVRIVDEADRDVPAKAVGEIIVRGPGVMLGYWNKPQETAQALKGGWMHTGDAGYMDEDGFIFVADRIKDMIVTGGENVYSVEVENAVARHPSVQQCAVIAIPDEKWGERVHAHVVCKPGTTLTLAELQGHCKSMIASYKVPRSLELVESLPMSGAGKILKNKLREAFWSERDRRVG
ncbi:long-chain-fatty-acid--CoA ligase [Variovorax sp. J22R133]|uniref:long-chain-fatty-acid--CoA ligase n=1 Tax=Variovorax brevis TaxID=3053503 RepID=UPI002576FAE7|nr:long-chain-fatty-acid--CoA ligase [Variovorax sp. J22R133]MDM0111847.1 long-chain-fatty-acid--CoA ligase [Variovorax sp. J22R133]